MSSPRIDRANRNHPFKPADFKPVPFEPVRPGHHHHHHHGGDHFEPVKPHKPGQPIRYPISGNSEVPTR